MFPVKVFKIIIMLICLPCMKYIQSLPCAIFFLFCERDLVAHRCPSNEIDCPVTCYGKYGVHNRDAQSDFEKSDMKSDAKVGYRRL